CGRRLRLHHRGMDTAPHAVHDMAMGGAAPWPPVPVMALLSFLALAAGVAIALLLRAAWAKSLSDFTTTRANCNFGFGLDVALHEGTDAFTACVRAFRSSRRCR